LKQNAADYPSKSEWNTQAMAISGVSANRIELLQIADAVAREKSIDRTIVIDAMQDAIQKAARSRYGAENDIRCSIDAKTGETRLTRVMTVVENVENDSTEVTLESARRRKPDAEIGDILIDELPPIEFGRVAAQNAKQVIVQKVRDAERERQFEEYKDRVGEIINGTVKRVEYGNVIVDLGRGEAIIRRDEMIPRETSVWRRVSAPMSTTCAASSAGRRSSCRARAGVHVQAVPRWKCRKSTTASSRSRPLPVTRVRARRSR
jgi:hypothetical protein